MAGARVSQRKVVSFTYQIHDEAGRVLEKPDLPVTYLHGGRGDIFAQVERALDGHQEGDQLEVTLTPDEAFGSHRAELTFTDELENVPPEFRFVGAEVEMHNDRGEARKFRVSRIADGQLTVDGNHPLAGKQITFLVTVVDVRDATPQETAMGAPAEGTAGTRPQLH